MNGLIFLSRIFLLSVGLLPVQRGAVDYHRQHMEKYSRNLAFPRRTLP